MASKIEIVQDSTRIVRRFNIQGRTMSFTIKPVPSEAEPVSWFKEAIEEIVRLSVEKLLPTDKVGVSFKGDNFSQKGPGYVSFRNAEELKMEDIWEMISKIFQSNSQGNFTLFFI